MTACVNSRGAKGMTSGFKQVWTNCKSSNGDLRFEAPGAGNADFQSAVPQVSDLLGLDAIGASKLESALRVAAGRLKVGGTAGRNACVTVTQTFSLLYRRLSVGPGPWPALAAGYE